MIRFLVLLQLISLTLAFQDAGADETTIRVGSRDELVRALADAKPGTTILIAPGTYRGGLSRSGLAGTKEQPIVVAGADPKESAGDRGGRQRVASVVAGTCGAA